MAVGFRPPNPHKHPPRPKLPLLWRMQGAQRIVAAGLYEHPHGTELRVYFEPEERDNVLQSYVEPSDVAALEVLAETLRSALREQGWWPIKAE